jgi:flavin reductase (DIM6/NTAB) family NADH-FMN oxidoreductase RutF
MLPFGNNDEQKAIERIVTIVTPQEAFLAAFSLHPAGVAVITGNLDDGTPAGFTATSLASFSATPPRATVNIAQHASSYPAVTLGKTVILHFLSSNQVSVSRSMAGDFSERFAGDHWAPGLGGLPQLHGVRAALLATVVAVTEVGDNATIVVEINDGETHPDYPPLVYVDRRYHGVGDIVPD